MPSISPGPKITPFLWFDGNAEEAVKFYTSVFPNSRVLATTHYGPGMPAPEGTVMTIDFEMAGVPFTALNGGPQYSFTEAVSFVVHCENQAEVDEYWNKLTADGGTPLACGWLKDKYGLAWQIVPNALWDWIKNPTTRDPMMKAMVQMVKLDLAKLRAAAEGR